MTRLTGFLLLAAAFLPAQDWRPFFNGKNLDGWEVRGDSAWTVLKDRSLLGQRPHPSKNGLSRANNIMHGPGLNRGSTPPLSSINSTPTPNT